MTLYFIAQSIGLIGYMILISASQFKTQKKIIQIETLAYLILCLQWCLLDQTALMVINILFISASCFSLYIKNHQKPQWLFNLLYPFCGLILLSISQHTLIDTLAMIALFCSIASRASQTMTTFRSYSIITAITFALCSAITMSIAPLILNIAFACGHIHKLLPNQKTLPKSPEHT